MEISLTKEEIWKVLSTLSTEEIEQRLEYNWSVWETKFNDENYDGVTLWKNK